MIENILTLISLVALIVGIFGKSWDDSKEGLSRLTLKGIIVIIIGIIACSFSLYKNYSNQKKIDWQLAQKAKIMKIAYSELDNALDGLIDPFGTIYSNKIRLSAYATLHSKDSSRFTLLLEPSFVSYLDTFNFQQFPHNTYFNDKTWGDWIAQETQKSELQLEKLWVKYSLYFDTETILQINSIVKDQYFKLKLGNSTIFIPYSKTYYCKNGNYRSYMEKLSNLKKNIDMYL